MAEKIGIPKWVLALWGGLSVALTVLSLPSVPDDASGWVPVLGAINNYPLRWLLPILGWISIAVILALLIRGDRKPKPKKVRRMPVQTVLDRPASPPASLPRPGSVPVAIYMQRARNAIEDELVEIIEEGQGLPTNANGQLNFDAYIEWLNRTARFIEAVFSKSDLQRFREGESSPDPSFDLDIRLAWLRDKRDSKDDWTRYQMKADAIHEAIRERRGGKW